MVRVLAIAALLALAGLACAGARPAAAAPALRPAVQARPEGDVAWTRLAVDDQGQAWSVALDDVRYTGDDALMVFVKADLARPADLPGGGAFVTVVAGAEIRCRARRVVPTAADFYDDRRALVRAAPADPAHPQVLPIAATIAEAIRAAFCVPGASALEDRPPPAAPPPAAPPRGPESARPVPVFGSDATASGTAWRGPKGYLVTAYHVVRGAKTLAIAQDGKSVGTAEVVAADPANDVAILKPAFTGPLRPAASIPLEDLPARLGEHVFTLGYPAPDRLGLSLKMTSGEVSSLTGSDIDLQRMDDPRLIQISAPVQSGNSGGPVIDDRGKALGIVVTKVQMTSRDEIAQNVNFALRVGYVRALLDALPDLGGAAPPAAAAASIVDAVGVLKDAVFLLVAEGQPES